MNKIPKVVNHLLAISVIVLLLCFTACHKKEDPAPTPLINVNNITETSTDGKVTGIRDTADWSVNSLPSETERALFNFSDTMKYDDIIDGYALSIDPAYPNPSGKPVFVVNATSSVVFKYVLVDEFMKRKASDVAALNKGKSYTQFNFDQLTSLETGKNYRLYYAFYNKNKQVQYFGFGDIKFVR